MGIIKEIFGVRNTKDEDILISKKDFDEAKLKELNGQDSQVKIIYGNDEDKGDETGIDVPEGAFVNKNGEIEYKIVEIEIHPARIVCPDCGGITMEGLEYCDLCGGELG